MEIDDLFNKYFSSHKMGSQPCLHYIYPSKSYEFVRIEKALENHNGTIFRNLKPNIDNLVLPSIMEAFPFFNFIQKGNYVHNYIQSNEGILEDFFTEYPIMFNYRCLFFSLKIDLLRKDKLQIREIKSHSNSYIKSAKPHWIFQTQIYGWILNRIFGIIPELVIDVITPKFYKIFKVENDFMRVSNFFNNYIKVIHQFESCKTGKIKKEEKLNRIREKYGELKTDMNNEYWDSQKKIYEGG